MKNFKIFAIILAVSIVLVCLFSGCGKSDKETDNTTEKADISAVDSSEIKDNEDNQGFLTLYLLQQKNPLTLQRIRKENSRKRIQKQKPVLKMR